MQRSSLTFAVVLLMGFFVAQVAGAAENDFLFQLTSPASEATPSGTAPDCQGGQSTLLPWETTPPATLMAASCGPCSVTVCQGRSIGNGCGSGRTCQNAYGNNCGTTPLTFECLCWSGPLP
jgi:hypothetical protein